MSFMASMRSDTPGRLRGGAVVIDADVVTWAAAVVTNGGTVSDPRKALVSNYVTALKSAGAWALTDDYWLLVAESEIQGLTSLKQRRLASAVAAPAFTIDRGYAFNGTSQSLNTGMIPSSHAVAMTGSDMRLAFYERTNVGASTYAAGTFDVAQRDLRVNARNSGNRIASALNSVLTAGTVAVTDSRGHTAVSRTAAGVFTHWKNGASVETIGPANASALPTRALFIGAYNNAGAAGGFRASTLGFVSVGASLSSGQESSAYTALQSLMTSLGAQV